MRVLSWPGCGAQSRRQDANLHVTARAWAFRQPPHVRFLPIASCTRSCRPKHPSCMHAHVTARSSTAPRSCEPHSGSAVVAGRAVSPRRAAAEAARRRRSARRRRRAAPRRRGAALVARRRAAARAPPPRRRRGAPVVTRRAVGRGGAAAWRRARWRPAVGTAEGEVRCRVTRDHAASEATRGPPEPHIGQAHQRCWAAAGG
jgi:hypothetical protein